MDEWLRFVTLLSEGEKMAALCREIRELAHGAALREHERQALDLRASTRTAPCSHPLGRRRDGWLDAGDAAREAGAGGADTVRGVDGRRSLRH